MDLLIDANILLDVLQSRSPFLNDSLLIWNMCEAKITHGYISTLSFANVAYIMRKRLYDRSINDIYKMLSLIFEFVDFTNSDIANAVEMGWSDFEDAVQGVIANRLHVDYIVTRNIRDFTKSKIPAITPTEFINACRNSSHLL